MSWFMFLACVFSYFIKGMTGFGNTLVFSSLLSFTTNNINISPLELLVAYPSNVLIMWQNRKSLNRRVWLPLVVLVLLGDLPGVFFLKTGNASALKCFFGLVVLALAVEMFLREKMSKKQKPNRFLLVVLGFISGLLCGLFGIGALLAAYVGRTAENTSDFKGNLCMVFTIEGTFRMILYFCTGIITLEIGKQALILLPFMVIGLLLGLFCSKKLPEKIVRYAVIALLFFSGISLILTNIGFL